MVVLIRLWPGLLTAGRRLVEYLLSVHLCRSQDTLNLKHWNRLPRRSLRGFPPLWWAAPAEISDSHGMGQEVGVTKTIA